MGQYLHWLIFAVIVTAALTLDLGFFHRGGRVAKMKEAILWSIFWIALALAFNVAVYFWRGQGTALEFLTAYLIEESLSVDNLFVFIMIFTYFGVDPRHQHKVLFWGILGVIVMRGIFIFAGVALIQRFHWLIYILGLFLVMTGIKMLFSKEREVRPERNPLLRLFRRLMPVTEDFVGGAFFVKREGRSFATPLFVVVLVVETTDILFAVDSIPAVLAITTDPFIVFTSNIFAVMGLRAIFFALSGFMQLFSYLGHGLAVILAFVGVKMLISSYYRIPVSWALGVVACILAISVAASLVRPPKDSRT